MTFVLCALRSGLRPGGPFHPTTYKPPSMRHEAKAIEAASATAPAHPARINPVVVSKFQVVKVLGQGGQVGSNVLSHL